MRLRQRRHLLHASRVLELAQNLTHKLGVDREDQRVRVGRVRRRIRNRRRPRSLWKRMLERIKKLQRKQKQLLLRNTQHVIPPPKKKKNIK